MLRRGCTSAWLLAPLRGLTQHRVLDRKSHPLAERHDISEPLVPLFGFQRGRVLKYRAHNDFHRHLVLRRMCTELVRRDHILVHGARGPALRTVADSLVTMAKIGNTESRQKVAYFLQDPLLVDKVFDEFPRRFRDYQGSYTMITPLMAHRRRDWSRMYMVEFKNRAMSDNHKGEDYSKGPERFFLPPRVIETERGVVRPPHSQMAFDRWASKFKSAEFHHWWRLRHSKLRYWGIRGIPHPAEVDPLWTEKDEEEWHSEVLASGGDEAAYDLDSDDAAASTTSNLTGDRPTIS